MTTNTPARDCPICLNIIENSDCCTTECGHHFHSSCIFRNFTNSFSCPMCRKYLVDIPQEDEDDEESEEDSVWETETEVTRSEEDETEEEEDKRKLNIRQVHEALKKQGYNETDFVSFIVSDYFDYKVRINQAIEDRSEALLIMIEKICYGQVTVDYRDTRSYASVLQGVTRTEEPGVGPCPVEIL
uniref:RING-type domain-containing protein n=1 Tax=viral metagenome TaxID=1070528 RepID=A0A6C0E0M1_9ZZZZ